MAKMTEAEKIAKKKETKKWTDLRSRLRRFWMTYWPARRKCLVADRVPYTGEDKRRKWSYQCAECGELRKEQDIRVDHKIPCGSLSCEADVKGFMYRLFFGELQLLCIGCHKFKTLFDNEEIKLQKKERLNGR